VSAIKNFSEETASRYALALYELAKESGSLDQISDQSKALEHLCKKSSEIKSYLSNPSETIESHKQFINVLVKEIRLHENLNKFLNLLASKRRFFYLKNILSQFLKIVSANKGEVNLMITTAKELSNEDVNKIKNEISKEMGTDLKLDYEFDKNLIGGVKVQIGSLLIDTSIKNKLEKISSNLIEK